MNDEQVSPFNPLDKVQLGNSVIEALLRQPSEPLASLNRFSGAGIYAIFYHGSFPAYKGVSERNQTPVGNWPIYVGKAVPKGARKGGNLSATPGKVLFHRISQHKASIEQTINLNIADFFCRFLIVDDIWIPLGEALLIAKYQPIWNKLVDGFGNHDPGKGRRFGICPRWDVLHPGRPWAEKCQPRKETAEQISTEVSEYLQRQTLSESEELPR